MVTLPYSVTTAAQGWQHTDWAQPAFSATAGTDGQVTIDCGQLDPDELWLIDHMVAQCSSGTPTQLRLYDTIVSPRQVLDGSERSGNFDVADWPNGLQVRSSRSLVAQWTGATAGAEAILTLQARVFRRVGF